MKSVPTKQSSDIPPPGNDEEPVVVTEAQEESRYVRIRFLTNSGDNAGLVRVYLRALSDGGRKGGLYTKSDDEGALQLKLDRSCSGLLIRGNDRNRYFEEQEYRLFHDIDDITITVEKLVSIELHVVYDDGEPFQGKASLFAPGETVRPTQFDESGNWLSGGGSFLIDENPFVLNGVRETDFALRLRTDRAGYDTYLSEIAARQIFDGARIDVVIAPSKLNVGKLIVDFGTQEWDENERWYYEITGISGDAHSRNSSLQRRPPEDNRIVLTPVWAGTYQVAVVKGTLVWQGVAKVEIGQETLVKVDFRPGCDAHVTIFNESGEPLEGAVLRTNLDVYVDYPASTKHGFRAVSDNSGQATLNGLWYGVESLVVEADGYEPVVVPVALNSGSTADIGPVHLVPSAGRVEVRVVNRKPGRTYVVMARHPTGKGGISTKTVVPEDGLVVYARLPMRPYLVAVTYEEGGPVASERVVLDSDHAEVAIEIDVGALSD
ncbi:MAG: carboxypeptidase-like regulatory domain-containing protein [Planctomycetota bacterium]